jgi:hypothetical protein
MKSVLAVLQLFACGGQSAFLQEAQSSSPRAAKQRSTAPPRFRELDWDTNVEKVQGAWMPARRSAIFTWWMRASIPQNSLAWPGATPT